MKKKYIYTIFIMLLLGCETHFDDEMSQYLVIDQEQEKIDLINGIYSRLVRVHNHYYFELLSRSDDITYYSQPSINYVENGEKLCRPARGTILPSITTIGEVYVNLYTAVINANNLICKLTSESDDQLVGEVYFLRAYCFLKQARLFGRPPLVLDTEVNYLLPKPEYREFYEQIEDDLLQAIALLPEINTDVRIPGETPHKGTAKALLAEVYMSMAGYPVNDESKYALAAQYAGEVINQAGSYGFGLLDDFNALWKEENRHNKENVFGLFYDPDSTLTYNDIGQQNISNIRLDRNEFIVVKGTFKPEMHFFKNFPDNYRKIHTLIKGSYQKGPVPFPSSDDPNQNSINDEIIENNEILIYHLYDPLTGPCDYAQNCTYSKWLDLDLYRREGTAIFGGLSSFNRYLQSKNTLYLLRYAHTLLTFAEASARSGNLSGEVYEAVNKVRRRANNVDINSPSPFDLTPNLTPEQFVDSVVWERAWELCFEPDGRWFDIVRLDMKDQLNEYRFATEAPVEFSADLLTSDWYFLKIPQEDRWLNPNFDE